MDNKKMLQQPFSQSKDSKLNSKSARNDNWIFFTALIISVLFWILIKLSDAYTVPYSFQVNYTNVPKEKRLTFMLDSSVNVDVTARGFEILELNLFENMDRLDINLDNFSLMKKEGEQYFVYTEELIEKLGEVIGIPNSDIHFSKNTLTFTLSELSEKVLPVKNLTKLQFAEQFDLYEAPVLSPEVAIVYGPPEVLDTLQQLFTDNNEIVNLSADQTLRLRLRNPRPDLLKFEPEEIIMKLRVEKFTASSIEIPIELPTARENIKLFPKTAKVFYKVAQKDYNNVRANQFQVVADIENVDINNAVRLQLKLTKKPVFVRNTTLDPVNVEFLIIE